MGLLLDGSGLALAEATLAASAWLAVVLVAVWGSRQPARRRLIARVGVAGLVAILPAFVLFPGRPRFLVSGTAGTAGTVPVLGWVWVVYGMLVLGGLGWVGFGALVGRWLVAASTEPGMRAGEIYRGLVRGRKVRPALRVSGRVQRPVLVGFLRPVVLIPTAWDERATPQRMRLGFLHELAHAENGDVAFLFLGRLAMACWAFLPGLPWLVRRMRQDHEILADLHAARCYGDWTQYATTLVDLAASHHRREAPELIEAGQVASPLTERLSALLIDPREIEQSPPAAWRASIPMIGMSCLMTLSTLQIGLPERRGGSAASPPAELREVFRLAEIRLEPGPDRPASLRVPFRLPNRHQIDCEVWCMRGEVNICGARVATGETSTGSSSGWHHFTLRHEACGDAVHWDGRPIGLDRRGGHRDGWLTFACPEGSEARIRNVEIRY